MVLQAGIFDLDGVITDTAIVHFNAWKRTFDGLLSTRFFSKEDYLHYVDGKPRLEGIASFFKSRGMEVPRGLETDDDAAQTVHGLANRKQHFFLEALANGGVPIFDSTVALIQQLRAQGIKTAVVSSSKNCGMVLNRAGIEYLFDARVDGSLLDVLGLTGKPHPDMFLEAAKRLDVHPENACIVEDALSGIQAGKAGGFGCVIGLDRHGGMKERFRQHGADVVLHDMHEISLAEIMALMNHDA